MTNRKVNFQKEKTQSNRPLSHTMKTTMPPVMPSSRIALLSIVAFAFLITCASAYSASSSLIDTRIHKAEFKLTSPEKLFSKVFAARLSKSEFETEAQYRTRLEPMRPSGTYFLLIPSTSIRYVYRAELQRLVVMAPQIGSAITVASLSQDKHHIPMQNAFGATVDALILTGDLLSIEIQKPRHSFPKGTLWQTPSDSSAGLPDVPGLRALYADTGLGLPVFLAPATAQHVVKNKTYGLVVGFTVADLTRARRDKVGLAPTWPNAIGVVGDTSTLPINVTYLAVLDRNTDDVIASWISKP
jgi:hypothetical protein